MASAAMRIRTATEALMKFDFRGSVPNILSIILRGYLFMFATLSRKIRQLKAAKQCEDV